MNKVLNRKQYKAIKKYDHQQMNEEVFKMNIQKLKNRYPKGFGAERSVNR